MKKRLLSLLLFASVAMAEVTNIEVSTEFVESNKIKIIDIRTEAEWKKLGVIPTAHLLTFFNKDYEPRFFLKDLDQIIEKDEQFAIISNKASRTKLVSNYLGNKHKYRVINLTGGMVKLIEEGYQVEFYNSQRYQDKQESILKKETVQIENQEHNGSLTNIEEPEIRG